MSRRIVMGFLFSAVVYGVVLLGSPSCKQEPSKEEQQKVQQLLEELKSLQDREPS